MITFKPISQKFYSYYCSSTVWQSKLIRSITSRMISGCCGTDYSVSVDNDQQTSITNIFPNLIGSSNPALVTTCVDSHCHMQLDPLFDQRYIIISNALSCGVSRLVTCGVCPGDDWQRIQILLSEYPDSIIGNFGLHPWWIHKSSNRENWKSELDVLLQQYPKVGVGECGLDKNITQNVKVEEQESILIDHIQMAKSHARPITIHCVGYWGRLFDLLKGQFGEISKKASVSSGVTSVILHSCNSMSSDMVPRFMKLNCDVYFSISGGGSVEKTQQLLIAIPRNRLLLETDSPDQIPLSLKSQLRHNEPCMIRYTCDKYADTLNISSDELSSITRNNFMTAFSVCL